MAEISTSGTKREGRRMSDLARVGILEAVKVPQIGQITVFEYRAGAGDLRALGLRGMQPCDQSRLLESMQVPAVSNDLISAAHRQVLLLLSHDQLSLAVSDPSKSPISISRIQNPPSPASLVSPEPANRI